MTLVLHALLKILRPIVAQEDALFREFSFEGLWVQPQCHFPGSHSYEVRAG